MSEKPSFFQAEFWQKQERVIGSAKGRGTTYFLQTEDWFGVNCALRHYYRGGLWGKLNKDRYRFSALETTRSFAEFHLLQRLYEAGLPVPKPIAARIQKRQVRYLLSSGYFDGKNRKRAGFNRTFTNTNIAKRNLEANWSFDSKTT